jgi:hypothetical protein
MLALLLLYYLENAILEKCRDYTRIKQVLLKILKGKEGKIGKGTRG